MKDYSVSEYVSFVVRELKSDLINGLKKEFVNIKSAVFSVGDKGFFDAMLHPYSSDYQSGPDSKSFEQHWREYNWKLCDESYKKEGV